MDWVGWYISAVESSARAVRFGALPFTFFLLLVTSFCYSGCFVVYPLVGIGYPYGER